MTTIPHRPLLAPWYRLVGDGDRLLLEHGQLVVVLEGGAVATLLPPLLPLLDGTRTVEEVVERVGPPARPAVELALTTLAEHGLLVEGPQVPADVRAAAHALAALFDLPPATAAERLRAARVGVVGTAAVGADVARLLRAGGIASVRRLSWRKGGDVDLALVAPAYDEVDALQPWNAFALERALTWIPLRPYDGRFAAVGPVVVPGESCCYECLLLRRAGNVDYGGDLFEIETAPVAATTDPGVDAMTAGIAAHLALRWLVGRDTTLAGSMIALEPRPGLALTEHPVLRVPRCPACSPAERAAPPLPWHAAEAA